MKQIYPPGSHVMYLADGTCGKCWHIAKGTRNAGGGATAKAMNTKPETAYMDPEQAARVLAIREANTMAGYLAWRRRREERLLRLALQHWRGIPFRVPWPDEDDMEGMHGKPLGTLYKPGLFVRDVK